MRMYVEQSLVNFKWWGGADYYANMLSIDELEELEYILEDCYPDGIDETMVNDIMRFDFDTFVCDMLRMRYDADNDILYRNVDDDDSE